MSKIERTNAWKQGAAIAAIVVGMTSMSTTILAQTTDGLRDEERSLQDGNSPAKDSDIVVTGTLLRGIAPTGSSVIGVDRNQIEATGAGSTNQLLSNLPQAVNFFNSVPIPGGAGTLPSLSSNARVPINRVSLRNLPGGNTSGGPQTLLLIDGHRVVGAGIGQVAVDADVVALGAIERVEAITDGGSAIYGSDAVGGVINFITRKRFDGVKVDGRIGYADDYTSYDTSVTVGRDWGAGSVYVAYDFSKHDAIFGRDRDYIKSIDWTTGIPTGRQCAPGNVSTPLAPATPVVYGLPGLTTTINACDLGEDQTFIPSEVRHSVFGGLTQELSPGLTFEMRAFYTKRESESNAGPFRATVTVSPSSPFYRPIDAAPGASQSVQFSYEPVSNNFSATQESELKTWGVTPALTIDLGHNWQVRALASYGESTTTYRNREVNLALQSAAASSTSATSAINPYDIASTPNKALLDSLLNNFNIGIGRNRYQNYRLIADGTLLALPGGEVRVAIGAEYGITDYRVRRTNSNFVMQPYSSYHQAVKSVFGELAIPIFGADNGGPGMEELTLAGSARYDEYNDFGDTFNPKLGITYKPLEWLTVRANWGKSFNAPSAADQLGVFTSTARLLPAGLVPPPTGVTTPTGSTSILLGGTVAGLRPQNSTNWSIGGEIAPDFVPGLRLTATYYHIRFKDIIAAPQNSVSITPFYRDFPDLYITNPTNAQVLAFTDQVPGGLAIAQAAIASGQPVGVLIDQRVRNLGVAIAAGVDFGAYYRTDTSFGSLDASIAGNVQTTRTTQVNRTAAVINDLAAGGVANPRTRFSATLGATIGKLRAQATLNHTSGYELLPAPTLINQTNVGSFNVANLYVRYDFKGKGLAEDLSLTLNVNNLFDQNPPVLRQNGGQGYNTASGVTIGRFFQLGISKKF